MNQPIIKVVLTARGKEYTSGVTIGDEESFTSAMSQLLKDYKNDLLDQLVHEKQKGPVIE